MDLFDLFAKISMDNSEYYNNLDEASEKTSSFGDKLKTELATAAKVGAAAIGAASAGIVALTKSSIEGYAEYEQLVGGVETLFGESAGKVQEYASNAFKTAGMSANDYMETVTSFSASLLQSLDNDTAAAAEKANLAITDMSDNANKMGTSMEMIQNAYNGFAKQNYTMLDNLKLGYGGTKEEMQRLLDKANELNAQQGIITNYQIDSYADIVDAIHVVQDEMGITGTTAKEAATTISGSVSSMKSAWSNLVTGIADDNADLDVLVGDFVDSAVTAAGNIAPRLEVILSGIGTLGEKMAPLIADGLSAAVENAPQFLTAAANMLTSLGSSLIEQSDLLIQDAFDLVLVIADGLIEGSEGMLDAAVELVENLAQWIEEYSDVLAEKAVTLIMTLVQSIVKNLPKLAVAALRIMAALATGLIENLPELIKQIPTIIAELVSGFGDAMPDIVDVGKDIVQGLWEGISSLGSWLGEKVGGFFGGIVDGAKDLLGIHSPSRVFAGIGQNMALGVGEGWDNEFDTVKRDIKSGLDFGTANIDFASSGLGVSSAGIINSMGYGRSNGMSVPGSIELKLTSEDGQIFGRWMVPFIRSEDKSNPEVVSDAV